MKIEKYDKNRSVILILITIPIYMKLYLSNLTKKIVLKDEK